MSPPGLQRPGEPSAARVGRENTDGTEEPLEVICFHGGSQAPAPMYHQGHISREVRVPLGRGNGCEVGGPSDNCPLQPELRAGCPATQFRAVLQRPHLPFLSLLPTAIWPVSRRDLPKGMGVLRVTCVHSGQCHTTTFPLQCDPPSPGAIFLCSALSDLTSSNQDSL